VDSFLRRLLTAVAALFLVAYVGYQAFQLLYSPLEPKPCAITACTIQWTPGGSPSAMKTVIPAETEGYRYYTLANGSKVAMKRADCRDLSPTKSAALVHQHTEELEAQIQELKTIDQQGAANRVNLDMINKQIDRLQLELAVAGDLPGTSGWKGLTPDFQAPASARSVPQCVRRNPSLFRCIFCPFIHQAEKLRTQRIAIRSIRRMHRHTPVPAADGRSCLLIISRFHRSVAVRPLALYFGASRRRRYVRT